MEQRTILIVDDEPDICDLFAFHFGSKGFKTLTAASSREAIQILENEQVEAILSDVRMPGGSGTELLTWTRRQLPQNLVFVLMTGYSDLSLETAFSLGAHGLFHKPLALPEVSLYIEKCLKNKTDRGPAQRRSERCPTTCDAVFSIHSGEHISQAIPAKVADIGRGGAFLTLQGVVPAVGTEVSFRFTTDGDLSEMIEGVGVCKWIKWQDNGSPNPTGFGLEFTKMPPDSVERLFAYLTHLDVVPHFGTTANSTDESEP